MIYLSFRVVFLETRCISALDENQWYLLIHGLLEIRAVSSFSDTCGLQNLYKSTRAFIGNGKDEPQTVN